MKFKKHILFITFAIGLLGLSGCAHYKAQPLRNFCSTNLSQNEQSIAFDYHVFNAAECKTYLDRDVLAKGYQPIYFTFINNTDRHLLFALSNSNLPVVPAEEVAHQVHTSTVKRVASYGVGALFIFPLIIPAVIDGFCSSEANKELDTDFLQKTLSDQIIKPHSAICGLIFVYKSRFNSQFRIMINDQKTDEEFLLTPKQKKIKL